MTMNTIKVQSLVSIVLFSEDVAGVNQNILPPVGYPDRWTSNVSIATRGLRIQIVGLAPEPA